MDPMTMMALASLASSAIGGKQLGQAAPAWSAQPSGGLLGPSGLQAGQQGSKLQDVIPPESQFPSLGVLKQLQSAGFGGAATEAPNWFKQGSVPDTSVPSGEMGPTSWQDDPNVAKKQNPFSGFFGNFDQNIQSPGKQLGLGLLGSIDPRLGYAGLLGMGLFGKNKILGK